MKCDVVLNDEQLKVLRKHFDKILTAKKSVIEGINQYYPMWLTEIAENAKTSYQDKVRLPGSAELSFIGNPPSWLERRYDDNEYLWQMNRMNHWIWLIYEWAITKDEKYAEKVLEELKSWAQSVSIDDETFEKDLSYFSTCTPLRALELGIRLYKTWPLIVEYMSDSKALTDDYLRLYANAVYKQACLIYKVSPQLWPKANHNHYVMELLGLLTTALYFPVFKESETWRQFAIKELERCAKTQLTKEGGQIEGCPMYHDGCMFWFGIPLVFAKQFNFEISEEYKDLFFKGMKYSLYSLRPTGDSVPVGDSQAGKRAVLTALYQIAIFKETSLLQAFLVYMNKAEILEIAKEFIWRFDNPEYVLNELIKATAQLPNEPKVFYNSVLSQAMIRSNWTTEALSFHMICKSPVQNNHAHIDLNTFDFTAYNKVIISDPGLYTYRECQERKFVKSTAAHSTITVDGKNQFEYIKSFGYGPQKEGKLLGVKVEERYQGSTGYHVNYSPVTHLRHVILVDGKFLLVVDKLKGCNNSLITRTFHFDYTTLCLKDNKVLASSPKVSTWLCSYPNYEYSFEKGMLSDHNDTFRPSTMVRTSEIETGEACYVSVLLPFKQEDKAITDLSISKLDNSTYEILVDCNKYYLIIEGDNYRIDFDRI